MIGSVSPRTYPLGVGTLAIGTSGYSITGLLPDLTTSLHTSSAIAGQLLTVFAVTCAVSGPLIAVATSRWERRRLLVSALGVAAAGNAMAAVGSSVTALLAARIVTAVGTAVYTANAVAAAARINQPESRNRATSVVFGGLTVALLIAVPASGALSAQLSYRGVFWIIAGLCALGALGIAVVEPVMSAPVAVTPRSGLRTVANRRILPLLLVAALACMSTFAVYTYAAVVLDDVAGVRGGTTSMLLVAYGLGAAVGNALSGHACDRYGPRRTLLTAVVICTLVLIVLPIVATTAAGAAVALAVWGGAFWGINPPLTTWTLELGLGHATVLLSLVGSAIYLGMGLGALAGGLVIAWAGPAQLGPIAGLSSAAAGAVLLTRAARAQHAPPSSLHSTRAGEITAATTTTQPGHPAVAATQPAVRGAGDNPTRRRRSPSTRDHNPTTQG